MLIMNTNMNSHMKVVKKIVIKTPFSKYVLFSEATETDIRDHSKIMENGGFNPTYVEVVNGKCSLYYIPTYLRDTLYVSCHIYGKIRVFTIDVTESSRCKQVFEMVFNEERSVYELNELDY